MKSSCITIVLLISSILFQRILFQTTDIQYHQFPFASGMAIYDQFKINLLQILYTFLPIPFVLFEFWGRGRDAIEGYGKLWLIRAYRRERLILNILLELAVRLCVIVFFQAVVFGIYSRWEILSFEDSIAVLIAYYVGLFSIVMLQFCAELFISSQIANILTNIFVAASLFLGNVVIPYDKSGVLSGILFPNLLFASRNGMIVQANIFVNFSQSMCFLIVILLILLRVSIVAFKTRDIF